MIDTSPAPIISVENLSKSFNGKLAVNDLNLTISPGIIFGFLGPNGSGKTTSLRMLCGLLKPDSGQGSCLGFNLITKTKQIQTQVGFMPQSFCLYRNLTVYENLDFIARLYGLKNRKEILRETLTIFSLQSVQNQTTKTLSGGWQQRVSLAAALLHSPRLLILDEPTSGIDPLSRLLIWDHIQKIVSEGTTVLLSTHHMDEAERCHQLAYMADGKLITQGLVQDIINSSGLFTWQIHGLKLRELKSYLVEFSDELQVIEKGFEMRLSSLDPNVINALDSQILKAYRIKKTETSLEDVFIFKIKSNKGRV